MFCPDRYQWSSDLQFKRQLDKISKQVVCHPKMMALQAAVLEHFKLPQLGSADSHFSEAADKMIPGRIIIFTSFRESVTEILAMLQKFEPAIRAR